MSAEKYIFTKPCTYDGKEYTEIELDLDNLTGKDIIMAEKEARLNGDSMIVIEYSKAFQAALAARAAKVPADLFKEMCAKDFSEITTQVAVFFLE